MSDAIWIALIGTVVGPAILAYLNARLGREIKAQGKVTERIRNQVENSHTANFRDDHDALREEVQAGFREIRKDFTVVRTDLAGVHEDVREVHKELSQLRASDAAQDKEISALKRIAS